MNLKSLRLNNYRNHKVFFCKFEKSNYIIGLNGAGKHLLLNL